MTLYARKKDLVSALKFKEEQTIPTQIGKQTIYPGDLALMDSGGNVRIVNEEWFNDTYVEVEKVKKPKIDYAEMAANYSQDYLTSSIEEDEYITEFQKKVKERNNNL